ncbi:hypothetical protein VP1G_11257 [Cytospora mali]|uniref:Uncharacterized protein n=1 Tax=Cytospora mali TaxID=578113 RepID=A0A194V932_CYTMA|nr:hypothetical protein VP1G_11257 [Valsa mali var. pyri (nom. inval.)]
MKVSRRGGLGAADHLPDGLEDPGLVGAHLLGGVALAQRDGAVLDGLEVDGDAEGGAELVVARVALADGGRRVVHAAGDAQGPELLPELARYRREFLVGGEGHDEDLCWGQRWGEGEDLVGDGGGGSEVLCVCGWVGGVTYTASFITAFGATSPEVVLEHGVQDSANTERGLDDVGGVFPNVLRYCGVLDLDQVLGDGGLAGRHGGHVDGQAALLLQLLGKCLALLLRRCLHGGLDSLTILLEGGAELLLVDLDRPLVPDDRCLQLLTHDQRSTGLLLVHREIVGRTVGTADTLDPAIRSEQLGVPAVAGVVGHLVGHVLPEADLAHVRTNLLQEQVDTRQEVAQGLIVDDLAGDRVTDGHLPYRRLAGQLGVLVQQGQLNVGDLVESRVLLATLRVDKVLDLGHQELAHSEQTSAGGNLVSVGLADGGGGEGHVLHVELEQLGEVQELTLGSLWPQVTSQLAGGANGSLEHEVEGHRCRGILQLELLDQLAELVTIVVVELGQDLLVLLHDGIIQLHGLRLDLLLLLLGVLLFLLHLQATCFLVTLQPCLQDGLDKVVGPQDLAVLGVLAHPVGELVDVTAGLEDLVGRQDAAVDLEHILLEDEVFPPRLDDVCLETAARRTVVEETGDTTVDLEGGGVEHAPAEHGLHGLAVNGLAGFRGEGRHGFLV